ncbi:PAS domain S-box protein [Chloroflexota bacterium]
MIELEAKHKRLEKEVRESEEGCRTILESPSNGICVFQDGEFIFVNNALTELTGRSSEELSHIDFVEMIHLDFRELEIKATQQTMTGDIKGLFAEIEMGIVRKNGHIRWVPVRPCNIK